VESAEGYLLIDGKKIRFSAEKNPVASHGKIVVLNIYVRVLVCLQPRRKHNYT